jgi:membrane protease subunit HflK
MPWQNNSGDGGGPWGSSGSGGPRNPWGGSSGGGSGGGSGRGGGPDFDEFIRRSQERLRAGLPGGRGGSGGVPWLYIVAAIVGVWLVFTSMYRVEPQQAGVIQRFGKYVETTGPGFHFKLPAPFETVTKPAVQAVNAIQIGTPDASSENLMLTGDQNIIDIAYAVRWKIKDPENYLFQLAEPEETIREVAESAMRAEISRVPLNAAIGPQRAQIAEQVRVRTQEIMDSYRAGVDIVGVDIKQADPPAAVDAAFKDVSAAQQNAEQYINEARAYAQQLLAQAQGQAAAFDAVYQQYRLAPEVTRKRMYLETMEHVIGKVDTTIVDTDDNVVPYLPLPEVKKRAAMPQENGQ